VRTALRDELGVDPGTALVTLHEEILRDSAPPVRAEPVTPRQLPHDIARFTGRADELATLDELLPGAPTGAAPTIVLIDGAPGVGKTTLAVHWAHRVADRYPDAQLHLNLRGYGPGEPLSAAAATEKLLRALGVPAEQIPSEVDDRATLLRSTLSGRKVLLLLDNAREAEHVRPLLPGTTGLVIVTSRAQLRGLSISDGARRVTLHPLPRRQSVELLCAAIGRCWVDEQPEAAAELVELCDRLPLAIAIVAERAHRAGSLAQVVAELANEQARLDVLDAGEDNPDASVRAALSWSYRTLSADAAALFRLLGMHPASDIEVRAAAALADLPVARTRVLLDRLAAAHLVEQRHPNRYELHDLIRLYANEMAAQSAAGDQAAAVGRVLDWYLHAAVAADHTLVPHRRRDYLGPYRPATAPPTFSSAQQAMSWFEQEYECLRSVCAWAAGHGFAGHAWRIAVAMTGYFHHTIPRREAVEFYHFAVAASATAGEPVGEGYTGNSLGCMYFDMDELDAAMTHVQRSLEHFLAESHRLGEAMTRSNIALLLAQHGNGAAARAHAATALALYEELGYARGIAQTQDSLGLAHAAAGDYAQAVSCYRQALAVLDQLGDAEVSASIRHHLAQAYLRLRDFPNATRELRRTIALYRALGNRRLAATALADFGTLLTEAGHPTLARSLWQTALPTLTEYSDPRAAEIEAALGPYHEVHPR
jgi:tetratricopeptide (TPR) repeat protein